MWKLVICVIALGHSATYGRWLPGMRWQQAAVVRGGTRGMPLAACNRLADKNFKAQTGFDLAFQSSVPEHVTALHGDAFGEVPLETTFECVPVDDPVTAP